VKTLLAIIGIPVCHILFTVIVLITFRQLLEARYIPSTSMSPIFEINDRILVDKASTLMRRPYTQGEIIVFYPPAIETGVKDLPDDFMHVMGRLTGFPCFPNQTAFIKRIIGLPGDTIRIEAGTGVYVNGKLLNESSYVKKLPAYSMRRLGDIGGKNFKMANIQYETDPQKAAAPVVVPEGQLFVLGDNRNCTEDSHIWGFLPQKLVIGRAYLLFWRSLGRPNYPPSIQQ
jgi:signal peptidase I